MRRHWAGGLAAAVALALLASPVERPADLAALALLVAVTIWVQHVRLGVPRRPLAALPQRSREHPSYRLRASDPGLPGRAWPRAPGLVPAR